MSFMFELYYAAPRDLVREQRISRTIDGFGGALTFREEPNPGDVSQAVCLTFEFENIQSAEKAADALRQLGEHVEGPQSY